MHTVNLYQFSELSADAKERAIEEWRDKVYHDIPWSTAFKDALVAGFNAWQKDIEWLLSDEGIIEQIEANECEFHEDGSLA